MKTTTIKTILILSIALSIAICSRINLSKFYGDLLPSKQISYQVFSGYQDINWYVSSSQASIYYSLWECSTKNFSDHTNPLIVFLNGEPGLSSQFNAFRQFGPIQIIKKNGEYSATQNPWSWNYYAHLAFVDLPVGVGFSYNTGKPATNFKTVAAHFVNFLSNFLKNNGLGLKANPLYLAGQGYAAQYISQIFQILNTNKTLDIQIQGVLLGGALIHPEKQINHYESFLQSAGILSTKQRDQTHFWTNQAILKIRKSKFSQVRQFLDKIWTPDASNKYYNGMDVYNYKRYSQDNEGSDYVGFLIKEKTKHGVPDNVSFVEYNPAIKNALSEDMSKSYTESFQKLVKSGIRILIYNGQNDFFANSAGMLTFLQDMKWNYARQWKETKKQIWKESGKISGWVKKYKNLIYVIVKGAGHYVYEDQTTPAKSMLLMLNNYLNKKW